MFVQLELSFRTSTSSAAASPAKTSRPPGKGPDSAEPAPDSGSSSLASSRRSRRHGSSSKTSRVENADGCPMCVDTCTCSDTEAAPWGLPPKTLELRTFGDASSLLPTPTASTYGSNVGGAAGRHGKARLSLESMARKGLLPTPCVSRKTWEKKGDETWAGLGMVAETEGRLSPRFVEWMMGFPDDWTRLESVPSEMQSSRNARRSPAGSSER